jgi:hypothetical protein
MMPTKVAPVASAPSSAPAPSAAATTDKPAVGRALLPGEQIISNLNNGRLLLTSHRVRSRVQGLGVSGMTSIMLEDVVSTSILAQSKPILLLIAAALGFLGLAALDTRAALSIASAGASIDVAIGESSDHVLRQFIDALEAAKDQRFTDRPARR